MSIETNISETKQNIPEVELQGMALAQLGQLALSDPSPAALFAETAALIAQTARAEVILLWQLEADAQHVALQASHGIDTAGLSSMQTPLRPDTMEHLVLQSPQPVLVDVLESEARFQPLSVLREQGVASGLGLRVGSMEKPQGVIEVFCRDSRAFSREDLVFLQSIANLLGLFLDAKHKQLQISAMQQPDARSGSVEWDRFEIKNRLVESRERERLQLAQELHDSPIQDLYGLMYQLGELRDLVQDPDGLVILEDAHQTIQRVVNNLRSICGEMRPPSLSPFGLEVAIRDHVEKLQKQFPDMQFHLELMRDQQRLSDSLRLCLFRIYQQSINNVMRHAEATDVYIRFRWDKETIQLEVEDNGQGFEVPNWLDLVRQEHFGLVGLAERADSVNGKLEVVSTPKEGTLVRVVIPHR